MSNYIGKNVYNIFENENIFNDICHNLTINSIDVPLKERK